MASPSAGRRWGRSCLKASEEQLLAAGLRAVRERLEADEEELRAPEADRLRDALADAEGPFDDSPLGTPSAQPRAWLDGFEEELQLQGPDAQRLCEALDDVEGTSRSSPLNRPSPPVKPSARLLAALAERCLVAEARWLAPEALHSIAHGMLLVLGFCELLPAGGGPGPDGAAPALWAVRLPFSSGGPVALFQPLELRARVVEASVASQHSVYELYGLGQGVSTSCKLTWEAVVLETSGCGGSCTMAPAMAATGLSLPLYTSKCLPLPVVSDRSMNSWLEDEQADLEDVQLGPDGSPVESFYIGSPRVIAGDASSSSSRGSSPARRAVFEGVASGAADAGAGVAASPLDPSPKARAEAKLGTVGAGGGGADAAAGGAAAVLSGKVLGSGTAARLAAYGFRAKDDVTWEDKGHTPKVLLRVVAHEEARGHTHYLISCTISEGGRPALEWATTKRLAHLRDGAHDFVKCELGDAYEKVFAKTPFAHRFAPRGTTARLDAWCGNLALIMASGMLRPVAVAHLLQFLEAPSPV